MHRDGDMVRIGDNIMIKMFRSKRGQKKIRITAPKSIGISRMKPDKSDGNRCDPTEEDVWGRGNK